MYTPAQFLMVQKEMRMLRIVNANLKRCHLSQKQRADQLREELQRMKQENEQLRQENHTLAEELNKTKRERDTYKGMVFKPTKHYGSGLTEQSPLKRNRGGQKGHQGYGRSTPTRIDRFMRVSLTHCPDCDQIVSRSSAYDTHTITDIPHWRETQPIITQYEIERQWCSHCHKAIHGQPTGVIPGSRLGINLVTTVLVWKYRCRMTFAQLTDQLHTYYGIHVSEGALVAILARTKDWFGEKYQDILTEIRGSPTKHGDETGYRVNGENWWAWIAATTKSTYYTIEESRGKGVAQTIFQDAAGVLVRDDYAAYEKLLLTHQSCWAHLLRKSHEAAVSPDASDEMKKLHQQLKELFFLLTQDVKRPFDFTQRQQLHAWYQQDITRIRETPYQHPDAQRIQTRIRNQNTNLITAVLYPDVPLTNNAAERAVKQVVGLRKISGGSKTQNGATIHAVNLSIIETIRKQHLPLLDTLQDYLLQGATGKN